MLSGLVYVSTAIVPFSPSELAELMLVSRCNNRRLGITGLLLYAGGNFIQALEGQEEAVGALYRTIVEDPRHHSITPLVRSPLEHRLFPRWAMGFREQHDLPAKIREEISPFLDDASREAGVPPDATHPAGYLLQNFALAMRGGASPSPERRAGRRSLRGPAWPRGIG
jgi:hypothetical protein